MLADADGSGGERFGNTLPARAEETAPALLIKENRHQLEKAATTYHFQKLLHPAPYKPKPPQEVHPPPLRITQHSPARIPKQKDVEVQPCQAAGAFGSYRAQVTM